MRAEARIELATADSHRSNLELEQVRRDIGIPGKRCILAGSRGPVRTETSTSRAIRIFNRSSSITRRAFRKANLRRVDLLRVELRAEQIHASFSNAELEEQEDPARTRSRNGSFSRWTMDADREV